jgi:hypothetical protein
MLTASSIVDDNVVSIWTIGGRQKIACMADHYQRLPQSHMHLGRKALSATAIVCLALERPAKPAIAVA